MIDDKDSWLGDDVCTVVNDWMVGGSDDVDNNNSWTIYMDKNEWLMIKMVG